MSEAKLKKYLITNVCIKQEGFNFIQTLHLAVCYDQKNIDCYTDFANGVVQAIELQPILQELQNLKSALATLRINSDMEKNFDIANEAIQAHENWLEANGLK